jgi:20S proteasome alpha/beta subunit
MCIRYYRYAVEQPSFSADEMKGKDYILLCADTGAGRSILKMKSDENKLKALGPHLAMAYSGEPGDTNNFADYVERNLRLYQIRLVPLNLSSLTS